MRRAETPEIEGTARVSRRLGCGVARSLFALLWSLLRATLSAVAVTLAAVVAHVCGLSVWMLFGVAGGATPSELGVSAPVIAGMELVVLELVVLVPLLPIGALVTAAGLRGRDAWPATKRMALFCAIASFFGGMILTVFHLFAVPFLWIGAYAVARDERPYPYVHGGHVPRCT